jgi:hypothetical protein
MEVPPTEPNNFGKVLFSEAFSEFFSLVRAYIWADLSCFNTFFLPVEVLMQNINKASKKTVPIS